MGLFSSDKTYLGVDVGNSSIKMVELKKKGKSMELVNYAFSEDKKLSERTIGQGDNVKYLSTLIDNMYKETNFKSRNAVATLPTSAVFSSVINLSNVDKNDLDSAVEWEAKKVIPTSLDDMTLDWQIIEEEKDNIKIFLTGSPKNMIEKYINIFKASQINLLSLETEIFSLIRSLAVEDSSVVMIVEIGTANTDISIIKKKIPVLNRSINLGGLSITKAISESLNIGMERAEQFKYDLGISSLNSSENKKDVLPEVIATTIKPIVNEIDYMTKLCENNNQETIESVILTGGSAFLPKLTDYIANILDKNVVIGDPWYNVSYPEELKDSLYEVGPRLAVAIGSAMRGIK